MCSDISNNSTFIYECQYMYPVYFIILNLFLKLYIFYVNILSYTMDFVYILWILFMNFYY